MQKILTTIVLFAAILPFSVSAQEQQPFDETTFKAKVLSVESFGERSIAETRLSVSYQKLEVEIVEGVRAGEVHTVENTTTVSFAKGDQLYVHQTSALDGSELWSAGEPERSGVLLFLSLLFIAVTVFVAGMSGVRSLISLVGSLLAIIFGLLPLLSLGAPPVLTCVLFAVALLTFSMAVTHTWNKPTQIALFGSVVALVIGAIVAEVSVGLAKLSGFASDEATYLHFATGGALDLSGLLLGGILIGVVGVLNDVSVSQVHTVVELLEADPTLSRKSLWEKAMRVGKEHVGAVINTLPLAYAGAALPLLLLFATSNAPFLFIINREIFSAEIIRILAGGIALALSGAIATACAVWLLRPSKKPA